MLTYTNGCIQLDVLVYKEIYREEYVAGIKSSKGYFKALTSLLKVPSRFMINFHHYYGHCRILTLIFESDYETTNTDKISRSNTSSSSCNSARTWAGLLGDGLAA